MIREKFIRALCPSNMHRPCQVGGLALPSRGVPCFVSSLFYSRGFGEKQPVGFFGVSLGGRNNAFLVYVYIYYVLFDVHLKVLRINKIERIMQKEKALICNFT